MLPLSFILPDAPRKGIVVNLATMRLFQFKGNSNVTGGVDLPGRCRNQRATHAHRSNACGAQGNPGRPGMCLLPLPRIIGKKEILCPQKFRRDLRIPWENTQCI